MNICTKIGVCCFYVIAVILSLIGLASFSLEIAKIALFNQTNGELKLNPIDYIYLCTLFLGLSGSWCCNKNNNFDNEGICDFYNISGIIISLIIYNEMGNIPFFCPDDYPYSSTIIRIACQVRAANLILLWISPTLIFFSLIMYFSITCCYNIKNDIDIV